MRTEYRVVTAEQVVYIADDGKEFDDEEDCAEYEFNLLTASVKKYCYDKNFEPEDIDGCEFVHIPTEKVMKGFKICCDALEIVSDGIDKPGIYMYSDYSQTWVNLDDVTSRFKSVLDEKEREGK